MPPKKRGRRGSRLRPTPYSTRSASRSSTSINQLTIDQELVGTTSDLVCQKQSSSVQPTSSVNLFSSTQGNAVFVDLDWIQVADHPEYYMAVNNIPSSSSLVSGDQKFAFTFVKEGCFSLIMTRSRSHCVEVIDQTDPDVPAARKTQIVVAPPNIVEGQPLPSGVTDGMKFSINYKKDGLFQIKSKKYSDLEHKDIVLDLKCGRLSPGTPILAHPDFGDDRYNQRWLFEKLSSFDNSVATNVTLGWIQLKDHTDRFINFDSFTDPAKIAIGTEKTQEFQFVIQPATYGQYGLLTSYDYRHVVRVTDDRDSTWSACRLIDVVPAPVAIVIGSPLPSNIDESLLFSIKYKNEMFQIKNKKYSDQEAPKEIIIDLYTGNTTPGTKIVAHPDFGDGRYNQRWTFASQFWKSNDAGLKYLCSLSTS